MEQDNKTTKKPIFFKDYQNVMLTINNLSKTAENPFFNSKYVELKTILNEVKRVCIENNFIFIQKPEVIETGMVLKTILRHIGGEEVVGCMSITTKDPNDPQKVGGGLTYARRYSLTCMFGIQEQDDDANIASQPAKVQTTQPTQPVQKTVDNTPPFPNKPANQIQPKVQTQQPNQRVGGQECPDCKEGKIVRNPKTNSLFCDKKCWLQK